MSKNDNKSGLEKCLSVFNILKAKSVSTLLEFFSYIARLITFVVAFGLFGAGFLSETNRTILVCSMIGIFFIEICIVTFLAFRKEEVLTEKRISQTPRKNKLSTTESKIETLDNKIKEQDQDDKKIKPARKQQTKSQLGFTYQVFI